MISGVFAEVDYSQITLDQSSVQVIEFGNYDIVRTYLVLSNHDNEEFRSYNEFLKTTETAYYQSSSSYDLDDVGNKTCPSFGSFEINAGLTEEFVICFKVPKSSQVNFQLELLDGSKDWCDSYEPSSYFDPCQQRIFSLDTAENISYESLLQTYVLPFENLDAEVTNLEVMIGDDSNLVRAKLLMTNIGNAGALTGYGLDIKAKNPAGYLFDTYTSYGTDCDYSSDIEINPGLAKLYIFCFEVPTNEDQFDIIFRSDYGFNDTLESCDSSYRDCRELFIDVDAGQALAQAAAAHAAAELQAAAEAQAAAELQAAAVGDEIENKLAEFVGYLGVSKYDIINYDIDLVPFKNYKKYQNDEYNFSIKYPADFGFTEDYDSAHGTTGYVIFQPESYDVFYLSVFGKLPNQVTTEKNIFEQLEFTIKSEMSGEIGNVKKFTKEVNGLKHHMIEFDVLDNANYQWRHYLISWVIVGDELWEINTVVDLFKIAMSLALHYDLLLDSDIDGEKLRDAIIESSMSGLQHSIESFEIKETKSVPAPVEPEPESVAEPKASGGCGPGTVLEGNTCVLAPEESSEGCGAGTVMVNGVCQLDESSTPIGLSLTSIPPLYIAGGAAAIGAAIIGVVFAVKRGSSGTSTPKPASQDLDDYEDQYLRRQGQRPTRKPAEKKETPMFCNNCGAAFKKSEAKFCGECGTPRS